MTEIKECRGCGSKNVKVTKVQCDGPDEFYAECCDCRSCTPNHITEENAILDWNDEDVPLTQTYIVGNFENVFIHGTSDPDRYKVVAACETCGGTDVFYISKEQLDMLLKDTEMIQNILPEQPAHVRELFVSGNCGLCWFDQLGFETDEEFKRYERIMDVLTKNLLGFKDEKMKFDLEHLIGWYSEWCNNKEEHELRELCNCYNIDREDYLHDMELIVKARNCILNNKVFNKTMFDYPS